MVSNTSQAGIYRSSDEELVIYEAFIQKLADYDSVQRISANEYIKQSISRGTDILTCLHEIDLFIYPNTPLHVDTSQPIKTIIETHNLKNTPEFTKMMSYYSSLPKHLQKIADRIVSKTPEITIQ